MKTDPNNPYDAFVSSQKEEKNEPLKSFTDELVKLKGQYLEIFIGESSEQISLDQVSTPYISSLMGKLIDVYDRFIVLDCLYTDKQSNELKIGNRIFLNSFQIRTFSLLDGRGSLNQCFLHTKDAEHVRKLLHQMHGKPKK